MRWLLSGSIAFYAFYFLVIGRKTESTKLKVRSLALKFIVLLIKKSQSADGFYD